MKLAGWILSVVVALFLAGASAVPKFMGLQAAIEPMTVVGWPVKYMVLIGAIEVGCMILFLIPRTALLGAVLTTGLLGGSLAANLRVDNPLFSHTSSASIWASPSGLPFGCAKKNSAPSSQSCAEQPVTRFYGLSAVCV
ncbi:DoxX family protein [Devosia aurantiaca]|uniref:DoxX family protein n=1 Tax=Devosia aurantiaca TaxID=2714858 RepID=UPI001F2CC4A3|nr:DoxX family protein [Devosia aurantiaca]